MEDPCLVCNRRIFLFKVLYFGVDNAPFVFNTLGQLLGKLFSLRGVSIIIYIDDTLVISDTSDKCKEDAQLSLANLLNWGSILS